MMRKQLFDAARVIRACGSLTSCNYRLFRELHALKNRHVEAGTHGSLRYTGEFTGLQTSYGAGLFDYVCNDLGMTVELDLEEAELCSLRDGLIVVSNHTATFDIPVGYKALEEFGCLRSYWTAKSTLEWTPWGWAMKETHGALVDRDRSEADRQKIRQSARAAARDGAAFVLFVEGTRVTEERLKRSRHKKLLEARTTGFELAWEEMPKAPVLSVTIAWDDGKPFRTVMDLPAFCGRKLLVRARLVQRSEIGDDPGAWLRDVEWPRKDLEIINAWR